MMTLEKLKTKYRQFKAWQKQPYQVAPMSHESHQCATCGTRFEGNYCPRCGQSASVGIYSFKKAFLLFLDVWGLGNRGMFRTIRDLLLRPGYMIRDYLQGMQMAYFPPFKMFFLLIALSLLVSSGFNIKGENRLEQSQELIMSGFDDAIGEPDNDSAAEASKQYSNQAYEWTMKHISLVTMVFLLLFSVPLYFVFRRGPACPYVNYSGFFVAVVYSMNMLQLYSVISNFFCLSIYLEMFYYLLLVIPIKQLSGYSYLSTLLRFILALFIFFFVLLIAIFGFAFAASMVYSLFIK